MGKADKKRRVYTKECKAEAVALAEKREKPIIQVARDWGYQRHRIAAVSRTQTAPGSGTGLAMERG